MVNHRFPYPIAVSWWPLPHSQTTKKYQYQACSYITIKYTTKNQKNDASILIIPQPNSPIE
jgi:hypothetical protein